ncbi:NAD/FAD-utilizing enzyme [Parahaliea maris]|uniref:NAD/FAD-utilizing enzyme n=1 Tax=Parahaliea maris TaxID=2716870 RepID=A0A5C8ZZZ4_9GAMM|nr:NAD/FAD-utilizing enzyme [Parahaliea maris]TXS94076.1 NAD/FAD-utilizing enzyme [Parahaliea maris]
MKRHYFISNDLDDLELVEHDLQEAGLVKPQIHVLSEDDAGVEMHHLHEVEAVLKKDVVHGTELGAVVGIIGAAAVLAIFWFTGITETYTWVPAIFLAVVVLGFCTWEGGLIGIGETHTDFRRFEDDLRAGRHVLFVDVDANQEDALQAVVKRHPDLKPAGDGSSTPGWVVSLQQKWANFMSTAP